MYIIREGTDVILVATRGVRRALVTAHTVRYTKEDFVEYIGDSPVMVKFKLPTNEKKWEYLIVPLDKCETSIKWTIGK